MNQGRDALILNGHSLQCSKIENCPLRGKAKLATNPLCALYIWGHLLPSIPSQVWAHYSANTHYYNVGLANP
jgi:hypothetical protein